MLQGSAIVEKAMVQEKELRKARAEEEERKEAERKARAMAEAANEEKETLLQQCETQEQTAERLTKKLETLWEKYQKARQEIEDVTEEFTKDKIDLTHTIRQIHKDLEWKNTVLENFVCREEQAEFMSKVREYYACNIGVVVKDKIIILQVVHSAKPHYYNK